MFTYQIRIEYLGTNFVGWQSQKNGKSVQDTIEFVLKKILKTKIRVLSEQTNPFKMRQFLFKLDFNRFF